MARSRRISSWSSLVFLSHPRSRSSSPQARVCLSSRDRGTTAATGSLRFATCSISGSRATFSTPNVRPTSCSSVSPSKRLRRGPGLWSPCPSSAATILLSTRFSDFRSSSGRTALCAHRLTPF
eukprot:Amastigsp_a175539_176.p3 type:complete len:123 gc:universal Amastigsp_a175539_176:109-477(+)